MDARQNLGNLLKEIFDPFFSAPVDQWEAFASLMISRTFRKNEIIKDSFETEPYLSFLLDGSAGIFLWSDKQQVCLDLCYENEFFGDYMSFLKQKPGPLFTQAIENCHLLSISYQNLEKLYKSEPESLKIGKAAAEALFIHKQEQQIELLALTAEERYLKLLEKQPLVVQRTPQKHLASYLGITPESFSRIRKNISRQN